MQKSFSTLKLDNESLQHWELMMNVYYLMPTFNKKWKISPRFYLKSYSVVNKKDQKD